jgi:hypothetical protein
MTFLSGIHDGFLKGPALVAAARTLKISTQFVHRENSIYMPFEFYLRGTKAIDQALIDSEATGNFIDLRTVVKHRLGTNKMDKPLTVYNIDRTANWAEQLTHTTDVVIIQGNKRKQMHFFVTNLGEDRIIFGYPWLKEFTPEINWKGHRVLGPVVKMVTLANFKKTYATILSRKLKEKLAARGVNIAQQMAEKAYKPDNANTEQTIPAKYQQHAKVFSEEEAQHFPPSRAFDHKIKLKPRAPEMINCKVYPVSREAQQAMDEYLDKNLE